jgi:hypothetical protein
LIVDQDMDPNSQAGTRVKSFSCEWEGKESNEQHVRVHEHNNKS